MAACSQLVCDREKTFRKISTEALHSARVVVLPSDTRSPARARSVVAVRDRLIESINESMAENEKKFLLSIKQLKPDWNLMPVAGIEQLPAIQWKLFNIRKMKKEKHAVSLQKLRAALGI